METTGFQQNKVEITKNILFFREVNTWKIYLNAGMVWLKVIREGNGIGEASSNSSWDSLCLICTSSFMKGGNPYNFFAAPTYELSTRRRLDSLDLVEK